MSAFTGIYTLGFTSGFVCGAIIALLITSWFASLDQKRMNRSVSRLRRAKEHVERENEVMIEALRGLSPDEVLARGHQIIRSTEQRILDAYNREDTS